MKKLARLSLVAALAAPLLLSGCAGNDASSELSTQGPAVVQPIATPSTFTSMAADTVFVPDLEGLSASEIQPVLTQLGLKAKWVGGSKDSNWVVTGMEPKMGREVPRGSTLTLRMQKASDYEAANAPEPSTPSAEPSASAATTSVSGSAVVGSGASTTATTAGGGTDASLNSGTSTTEVSYANCDAVRAAGKAPIRRGQPGYELKLDRDGDGVGCE